MFRLIKLGFFLSILLFGYLGFIFSRDYDEPDRVVHEIENVRSATTKIFDIFEKVLSGNTKVCDEVTYLQKCIFEANGQVIVIPSGAYRLSSGLKVPSNSSLYISKGALITLSDDADMPHKGGYVIGVLGAPENTIENVTIIVNGVVDGNREVHSYDKSGNEGIRVDYGNSIVIAGSGQIRNVSGDGIDFDVTKNSFVLGVRVDSNRGSGVHFGGGRPISTSRNVQVVGVLSTGNGFESERYGLDASWPNTNPVTYGWSLSDSNYKNWDLAANGTMAVRSASLGNVVETDSYGGASIVDINEEHHISLFKDFAYKIQLLKRDLRLFLGLEVHDFLLPLEYERDK